MICEWRSNECSSTRHLWPCNMEHKTIKAIISHFSKHFLSSEICSRVSWQILDGGSIVRREMFPIVCCRQRSDVYRPCAIPVVSLPLGHAVSRSHTARVECIKDRDGHDQDGSHLSRCPLKTVSLSCPIPQNTNRSTHDYNGPAQHTDFFLP